MDFNQFLSKVKEFDYQNEALFKFNQSCFKIKSNNKSLIDELNEYFSEWKCTETDESIVEVLAWQDINADFDFDYEEYNEVGKKRVKEVYKDIDNLRVVKKTKTGVKFITGGDNLIATGPLTDNPNQLINFINAVFMETQLKGDSLLFHAAGIAKNGKGLVLAAQSGKGKSTTALNVMNEGLDFVSNDRIVLQKENGFKMIGVPKHPRINPGTILNNSKLEGLLESPERFDNMSQEEIWNWEEKYDAIIPEYYGENKFTLVAECQALLIIDWGEHNHEPRINKLDLSERKDLLPAIMKAPSLMTPEIHKRKGKLIEEEYLEFLSDMNIYILTGTKDSVKATKSIVKSFF